FIISWISWIAFIVIAPIEVQAVIQYSSSYFPTLVNQINHVQHLTTQGFVVAFLLLLFLTITNSISVKFMSHTNFILTLWKLSIPVLVIVFFLSGKFELHNLTQYGGFAPQGAHGVFASLAIGGIILAFNGFQPGVALAGETKNPQKNIPIAIIGSLVICTAIYCLLQFSFLMAIPSQLLKNGWSNLSFAQEAGPLAGLLAILGVFWFIKFLYLDSLVSPMGTAMVFFAAAARSSFSMSKNLFLPKFFQKTTKKGIPVWGVVFNFFISCLIFLTFSGWQEMAAFYAAAICLCNSFIPLVLITLRKHQGANYLQHTFKIPCYKIFSFIAFYISNLMLYWCGWDMIFRLDAIIIIGLILVSLDSFLSQRVLFPDLKSSFSFFFLIISMSIASKLSNYGNGIGLIDTRSEFVVVFVLSTVIFSTSNLFCFSNQETSFKIREYRNL
ncbi:MAG: APC family permease, partial [Bdellovibrionota bacterium]